MRVFGYPGKGFKLIDDGCIVVTNVHQKNYKAPLDIALATGRIYFLAHKSHIDLKTGKKYIINSELYEMIIPTDVIANINNMVKEYSSIHQI